MPTGFFDGPGPSNQRWGQLSNKAEKMRTVSTGIGGKHSNEGKQKLAEVEENEKTVLELFKCVKKENKEELQKLLTKPTLDVTVKDKDGNTPLHYAAKGNVSEILEMLLKQNAETANKENNYKRTPLHIAAEYNKKEIADKLIECNADVQAEDSDDLTPLLVAVKNNSYDVVSLLLEQSGSIRGNEQRKKAIKLATEKNSVEMLNTIFQHLKKPKEDDTDEEHTNDVSREDETDAEDISDDDHKDEEEDEDENDFYDDTDDEYSHDDDSLEENESTADWLSWSDDESYILFDDNELQPIHIAAQNEYLECLELLLENGADVFSTDENSKTALHFAAAHGKIKVVELLLFEYKLHCLDKTDRDKIKQLLDKIDKDNKKHVLDKKDKDKINQLLDKIDKDQMKQLLDKTDKDKKTALHASIKNERILELLLKAGASVNIKDKYGRTLISYAAEKGQVETIRLLRNANAKSDLKDNKKRLPVHYAAMNGHSELIRLFGSEESVDYKKKNYFDLAIDNNHEETVLTIFQIEGNNWDKILRRRTDKFDTPMRKLIRYMPDVAREVFNRCIKCEGTGESFKVEFNYEFLDDTFYIGSWGNQNFLANEEQTKDIHKQTKDINEDENIDHLEDINSQEGGTKLENDMSMKDDKKDKDHQDNKLIYEASKTTLHDKDDKHAKPPEPAPRKRKGKPYEASSNFRKSNHPLMIMVDSRRQELLSHPLVSSLLKKKWGSVGLIFHLLNFFIYAAFLSMLTGFAIDVRAPFQFSNYLALADNDCSNDGIQENMSTFATVAKYAVIGFASLELIIEILEMRQMYSFKFWLYFMKIENVLDWIACTTAVLFVVNMNGCSDKGFRPQWQWNCGAISVFLAWMNLLFIIQKFEWIGIYVVMLFRIVKVFMKFFLVFFLLIVAFAVSFHCLLQNQVQFSTFWISLVKTTVMMVGELDFGTIFIDEHVHYDIISYVFFYVFVLFMTIVVINLLVGLAVENIQEFQKQADLTKKEMQVKFALEMERLSTTSFFVTILNCLRRKDDKDESADKTNATNRRKDIIYPKKQNWFQRKDCESWKLTETDIKSALKSDLDGTTKEIARLDAKFKTLESNLKTKMRNIDSNLVEILRRLGGESNQTAENLNLRMRTKTNW